MRVSDPVIILSPPRSGSSWFSGILSGHPEVRVHSHINKGTLIFYMLYPLRTINPFTGEPIQRVFCPPRPKTYLEIFKAVGCPNAPEDATLQDALEYAEVAFDG